MPFVPDKLRIEVWDSLEILVCEIILFFHSFTLIITHMTQVSSESPFGDPLFLKAIVSYDVGYV